VPAGFETSARAHARVTASAACGQRTVSASGPAERRSGRFDRQSGGGLQACAIPQALAMYLILLLYSRVSKLDLGRQPAFSRFQSAQVAARKAG